MSDKRPTPAEIHDALVVCYNATPNESLRELIALMEIMILGTAEDE